MAASRWRRPHDPFHVEPEDPALALNYWPVSTLYAQRKAEGVCVECGVREPRGPGYARCESCIERIRGNEADRVERIRAKMRAERPARPTRPTPLYDGRGNFIGWRVWDGVESLSGDWRAGGGSRW